MIQKKQINEEVQKTLFRKIDAVNRLALSKDRKVGDTNENKNFFTSNSLEPQDRTNPFEQQMYRNVFAKVSVGIEEKVKEDEESKWVKQPISLSSYMNLKQKDDEILNTTQNNSPISFFQGYGYLENGNRFRGHSGITKISVKQNAYYTYTFTIDWTCPDPVYFEEKFEPLFLQLGTVCAVEFGWGVKNTDLPPLTINQMATYLSTKNASSLDVDNLRRRNTLDSKGNSYTGVGTITKFNYSINENGVYTGTIEVLTPGANFLLQKTQDVSSSGDEVMSPIKNLNEQNRLYEILMNNRDQLEDEALKEIKEGFNYKQQQEYNKLATQSVSFQTAMKNLPLILEKYLEDEKLQKSSISSYDNPYNFTKEEIKGDELKKYRKKEKSYYFGAINHRYKFKDGLLLIKPIISPGEYWNLEESSIQPYIDGPNNTRIDQYPSLEDGPPTSLQQDRYFMSWAFFEDIILNSFFQLEGKLNEEEVTFQQIKSVQRKVDRIPLSLKLQAFMGEEFKTRTVEFNNKCFSSKYLYSMGLDFCILPGKHHPLLLEGFNTMVEDENGQQIEFRKKYSDVLYVYSNSDRIKLTRILSYYKIIDKVYKPFTENKNNDYGYIRNMVFPMEMFQRHFENMSSTRQSIKNFWSEVSNHYGRVWRFEIGQDQELPFRIGISELNYTSPNANADKPSKKEEIGKAYVEGDIRLEYNKMFTLPIYSKNSIVTSYNLSLDLSKEAATIARYGSSSITNTKSNNDANIIPLMAYSLLNSKTKNMNIARTLEQYRELIENGKSLSELRFPTDPDNKGKVRLLAYGDEDTYKKDKPGSFRQTSINKNGLDILEIETIKEDLAKVLERYKQDRVKFVEGVGLYNFEGNFSEYFKQVMNYAITSAQDPEAGSLMTKAKIMIPVKLTLELDGMSGLEPGDVFLIDYLPKVYRDFCFFMITKVEHSVSKTGWTTSLETVMVADMKKYAEKNKGDIGKKEKSSAFEEIEKMFKLTNVPLNIIAGADALSFDKLDESINGKIDEAVRLINEIKNDASPKEFTWEALINSITGKRKRLTNMIDDLQAFADEVDRILGYKDLLQETAVESLTGAKEIITDTIKDLQDLVSELDASSDMANKSGRSNQDAQVQNLKDGSGESVQAAADSYNASANYSPVTISVDKRGNTTVKQNQAS